MNPSSTKVGGIRDKSLSFDHDWRVNMIDAATIDLPPAIPLFSIIEIEMMIVTRSEYTPQF